LNPGPPVPQTGALTGLRYAPFTAAISTLFPPGRARVHYIGPEPPGCGCSLEQLCAIRGHVSLSKGSDSMEPIMLQQVVDCPGATIRNDALQPVSEPILTVTLKAQDGQLYLLPLSEQGAKSLLEVISSWWRAPDFP
jgi:hypothetical protein